jgi:putative transposase
LTNLCITKLATQAKGVFLMAYVIIDLFSRFVVGWMLASKECKHLAAQLLRRRRLGRPGARASSLNDEVVTHGRVLDAPRMIRC